MDLVDLFFFHTFWDVIGDNDEIERVGKKVRSVAENLFRMDVNALTPDFRVQLQQEGGGNWTTIVPKVFWK